MQDSRARGEDLKDDARIGARKPIDDGGDKAFSARQCVPDLHLPGRRVGEKLDVLHTLAQVIERGHSAIEQRTTVLGRFDSSAMAFEQAYAERLLELRNR